MCYTASTSVKAFIIGCLSSLCLISQKSADYKIIGWFFMFIILMQLYDAIFWTNPAPSNINRLATKAATITNHLQPIVLCLLILYFKGKITDKSRMLIWIYAISIIVYTMYGWNTLTYTEVTQRSNPSLDWRWNHFNGAPFVYALFLGSFVYLFMNELKEGGLITSILCILTFLFSVMKYQIKGASGRFWCYFAAFCPLIVFLSSKWK